LPPPRFAAQRDQRELSLSVETDCERYLESRLTVLRAVFLNRLREIRDRSFENQRYRASGLNLVVTGIILWNTVYLERTAQALRDTGQDIDEKLLPHLSIPVAAGLGAHQPDRRLHLAATQAGRTWEVPAAPDGR